MSSTTETKSSDTSRYTEKLEELDDQSACLVCGDSISYIVQFADYHRYMLSCPMGHLICSYCHEETEEVKDAMCACPFGSGCGVYGKWVHNATPARASFVRNIAAETVGTFLLGMGAPKLDPSELAEQHRLHEERMAGRGGRNKRALDEISATDAEYVQDLMNRENHSSGPSEDDELQAAIAMSIVPEGRVAQAAARPANRRRIEGRENLVHPIRRVPMVDNPTGGVFRLPDGIDPDPLSPFQQQGSRPLYPVEVTHPGSTYATTLMYSSDFVDLRPYRYDYKFQNVDGDPVAPTQFNLNFYPFPQPWRTLDALRPLTGENPGVFLVFIQLEDDRRRDAPMYHRMAVMRRVRAGAPLELIDIRYRDWLVHTIKKLTAVPRMCTGLVVPYGYVPSSPPPRPGLPETVMGTIEPYIGLYSLAQAMIEGSRPSTRMVLRSLGPSWVFHIASALTRLNSAGFAHGKLSMQNIRIGGGVRTPHLSHFSDPAMRFGAPVLENYPPTLEHTPNTDPIAKGIDSDVFQFGYVVYFVLVNPESVFNPNVNENIEDRMRSHLRNLTSITRINPRTPGFRPRIPLNIHPAVAGFITTCWSIPWLRLNIEESAREFASYDPERIVDFKCPYALPEGDMKVGTVCMYRRETDGTWDEAKITDVREETVTLALSRDDIATVNRVARVSPAWCRYNLAPESTFTTVTGDLSTPLRDMLRSTQHDPIVALSAHRWNPGGVMDWYHYQLTPTGLYTKRARGIPVGTPVMVPCTFDGANQGWVLGVVLMPPQSDYFAVRVVHFVNSRAIILCRAFHVRDPMVFPLVSPPAY